jgi:hypothetical protein
MARHPKPENANNPLRRLRKALAKDGVPMSQGTLSKMIGVPVDTIKSTETARLGRGMPSPAVRAAIFTHLGILWNEEASEWRFLFSGAVPSREDVDKYRTAPIDREVEIHALCLRLICLLQTVPQKRFAVVADTINAFLLDVAKDQNVDTAQAGASLELHPVWRDGTESGDPADIIGYERKREAWMWHKTAAGWKKRNSKGKLFDFRDRLSPRRPKSRAKILA